jgi:hypothetical protein
MGRRPYATTLGGPPCTTARFVVDWQVWVNRRRTQFEHNRSAYPPLADIRADIVDGSEVPLATKVRCSKSALFDHLVRKCKKLWRNIEPKRFRGIQIDHQFDFDRLQHRQIRWLGTSENPSRIRSGLPPRIGKIRTITHEAPGGDEIT